MDPEPLNEFAPKENLGAGGIQEPQKEHKPPKIRGALILVAFCLFLSLFQNLGYFLGSIAPIIRSPLWERYTNPSSPKFHPQWKLVIICDAVIATSILFWNIALLVFFFRRKSAFPVLVAASLPIIFLLILASYYLGGLIPAVAGSAVYAKQGRTLIIKFIGLHIWIPYLLLSKRVAKTFVR